MKRGLLKEQFKIPLFKEICFKDGKWDKKWGIQGEGTRRVVDMTKPQYMYGWDYHSEGR